MRLSVVENNFPGKEDVSAKSLVYESLAFTTQECLLKELENRFPSTCNLCSLKKEEIPEGRCMDFGSCRKSGQGPSSCLCLVPAGWRSRHDAPVTPTQRAGNETEAS